MPAFNVTLLALEEKTIQVLDTREEAAVGAMRTQLVTLAVVRTAKKGRELRIPIPPAADRAGLIPGRRLRIIERMWHPPRLVSK